MRAVSLFLAIAAFGLAHADSVRRADALALGEKIPLWPAGRMPDAQEHQIAAADSERKAIGFDPQCNRMPYLQWFPAPADKVKTDVCMIIVSGGAYKCCYDGPAFRPIVRRLLAEGVHCVNLTYRTPRPKGLPIYQTAWEDGQRAVRLVRSEAASRGFSPEKIGVVGCSAGSHLSLLLATSSKTPAYRPVDDLDKLPCHVNCAIPMCPAYVLSDGLEGKNASGGEGAGVVMSSAFAFDSKTCPMCLFHGGEDPYSPLGSTMIYRRLRRMKIPAELHLYGKRGHGVVDVDTFERAIEFLRQIEFLPLGKPIEQVWRFSPGDTMRTELESLWPDGKVPDADPAQTREPYLIWYIPREQKTKAVQIVFPGGGYNVCCINHEGAPIAHMLNREGMTAVVVGYRCPRPRRKPKHLSAWQDAQRAVRMVRAEAQGRGLDRDRIGVVGFSAGGHLALMLSTNTKTPAYEPVDDVDSVSCSVQWAFPIYPAYVLSDGATRPNAKGGNEDDCVVVPEFSFDDATPPMCFIHGDGDVWSAMNSVKVWERLRGMGIRCDLHTLAKRGHSFQVNASLGTGSYSFMDRLKEFLSARGLDR